MEATEILRRTIVRSASQAILAALALGPCLVVMALLELFDHAGWEQNGWGRRDRGQA